MTFKKIKKFLLTLTLTGSLVVTTGCNSDSTNQTDSNTVDKTSEIEVTTESSETIFTKEELAKYDGKNGNESYVAVNGVVYNVTNVDKWRKGMHEGVSAGIDLSSLIGTSPHGTNILKDVPIVGKYQ